MRKNRYKQQQIAVTSRQGEARRPVEEICRKVCLAERFGHYGRHRGVINRERSAAAATQG